MRSNPPPAVNWGGCHVPSKTPAQLQQLAALREQGALTDDEFATAKARLFGSEAPSSRRT
jgi:hypothetical protein